MAKSAPSMSVRPATRDVEPLDLEHDPAAAGRRGKAKAQRPLLGRPVDPLDPLHRLQLALRLARLRAVPEAVDEPLEVGQLPLLALERVGLRRQPLGLQPPPVRVAALVVAAAAAVDLEHPGRDRLQEPAVVRDEHDARVEAVQMLLEPLDGRRVEVVGRLVQQQQIRLGGERPRQRCPRQLAARERPQLAVEVGGREPEAARHPLQARAPAVPAGPVERPLGGVVAAHHGRVGLARGHAPLELGELGLEPARVGRAGADVGAERDVAVKRRALVVQGDPRAGGHRDLAPVGLKLAGQDPEQGRLPGTVSADQRDPVAGPHDGRHVGQDLVRSEGERHARDVQRHPRIMPAMIGLFPTCLGDAVYPRVVSDAELVLRRPGRARCRCAARPAAGSRRGTAGSSQTPAASPGRPCGRWPTSTPWSCRPARARR